MVSFFKIFHFVFVILFLFDIPISYLSFYGVYQIGEV